MPERSRCPDRGRATPRTASLPAPPRGARKAPEVLKATLRNVLSHKLRLLLSAVAVILGVSFVAGSFVFTDTIGKTFRDLFESVSADVTVSPRTEFDAGFTGTV